MPCSLRFALVCRLALPQAWAFAEHGRLLCPGLAAIRAVPDLTLAILCVILFGIGPGAGLLALAIYYTAVVTKIFADIVRTAPRGPLYALGSTGASRIQMALFGVIPLKRTDLLSYGSYEFESALRASIVVGAVGGGGLGGELVGSLAAFDFPRVTTQILLLVAVVAILDQVAAGLSILDGCWHCFPSARSL